MKTNKSLTSSPCDDMNTVPNAEQKAKDCVGKENGMNLSDHESSESDGDTDAMCGNVRYSCVDIPYNWSLMEHKDEGIHLHT
jgi:hypothetical protein